MESLCIEVAPYSEYVFAREEKEHHREIEKLKPQWINIVKEYEKKQKKSYKEKGASMINFNQLGAIEEEVVEDALIQ